MSFRKATSSKELLFRSTYSFNFLPGSLVFGSNDCLEDLFETLKFCKDIFKKTYIFFKVPLQGWTNLFLCALFFGGILFGRPIVPAKKRRQNQTQCGRLIEKQLEITNFVLCYLNCACRYHFYCNFIKSFCNEALECECC